jgi:uncharacterized protein (DUF983 family)
MTPIQTIAGINRCPQCGQTRMFRPTACWQAGQVFIAAKVFSTGGDVKRSATSGGAAFLKMTLVLFLSRCERRNSGKLT